MINVTTLETHVHASKEEGYDYAARLGLDPDSAAAQHLALINYEVKLTYDVRLSDGKHRIIAVNDIPLTKPEGFA